MTEPEPGGFELMRGIRDLRAAFDQLAASMVTQATFAIWQQAQKDSDDRKDARILQLERDRDEDRKARAQQAADERKTKAQQWFAIGITLLGGIVSIITGVIAFNLKGGMG